MVQKSQPLSFFLYYVLGLVVFYSYFLSENYIRTIWTVVVENFMEKSGNFFISVALALAFRVSKRKNNHFIKKEKNHIWRKK